MWKRREEGRRRPPAARDGGLPRGLRRAGRRATRRPGPRLRRRRRPARDGGGDAGRRRASRSPGRGAGAPERRRAAPRPLPPRLGDRRGRDGNRVPGEVVEERAGLSPGSRVAVKVVHPHLLGAPGFVQRFLREAQARPARSTTRTSCARCDATSRCSTASGRSHFLVMEYVEGQTLRDAAPRARAASPRRCAATSVARSRWGSRPSTRRASSTATSSPRTCSSRRTTSVKVMDLGVARLRGRGGRACPQTGAFVGIDPVRGARAVPRRSGGTLDGRADLYALGVVLYELADGRAPLRGRRPARARRARCSTRTPRRLRRGRTRSSRPSSRRWCTRSSRRTPRSASRRRARAGEVLDAGRGARVVEGAREGAPRRDAAAAPPHPRPARDGASTAARRSVATAPRALRAGERRARGRSSCRGRGGHREVAARRRASWRSCARARTRTSSSGATRRAGPRRRRARSRRRSASTSATRTSRPRSRVHLRAHAAAGPRVRRAAARRRDARGRRSR